MKTAARSSIMGRAAQLKLRYVGLTESASVISFNPDALKPMRIVARENPGSPAAEPKARCVR